MDAYTVYGFSSYTPSNSGVVQPGTDHGEIGAVNLPKLPIIGDNPLLWLLMFLLIFTGYLYGVFDVGVRRVGEVRLSVGK